MSETSLTPNSETMTITDEIVEAATTAGTVPESEPSSSPAAAAEEITALAKARRAEADAAKAKAEVEKIRLKQTKSAARETPLSRFVGSPEAIKVWKVQDDGKREYINRYRYSEVRGFNDVETFVDMRLRESHGDGMYEVTYIDKSGNETAPIEVLMARPVTAGRGSPSQAGVTARDLVEVQREAREDARREQERIDERLKGLLQQAKTEGGTMGPVIAAMIEAFREGNSRTVSLLERKLSQPAPIPPPPAPAFNSDVMLSFMREAREREERLEIEREKIRSEERKFQMKLEEDRRKSEAERQEREIAFQRELATQRKEEQEKDRQHTLELAKLNQAQIKDPIEELLKWSQAQEKLQGLFKSEPSWIEVAQSAVENLPDLAEKIGKAVGSARTAASAQSPPQQQLRGLSRGGARAGVLPPAGPEQDTPENVLAIPDGFGEYAKAMIEAKDDAERVEATIKALGFLREFDEWSPHVNNLLMTVLGKDSEKAKQRALIELAAFLNLLAKTTPPLVPPEVAARIGTSLSQNWDVIRAVVKSQVNGEEEEEEEEEEEGGSDSSEEEKSE